MFSWIARGLVTRKLINRIAPVLTSVDAVVTHSNGANFCTQALNRLPQEFQTPFVFHFSPALDRDTAIPFGVKECNVFYTHTDWAVRIASYLPFHPWGRMGAWGPSYEDERLVRHDYSGKVEGHSDWFLPEVVDSFADIIHEQLEAGLR
jgi:hypothetical protein